MATSNPYTVDGLSISTPYTAKVRAYCNAGDQSAWSAEVNFNTTAVAEAVGDSWSDDFEGGSCGWELVNGTQTNAWAWGTATNNGGTHALYVSNDGGTTNAYTVNGSTMVYATKLLNFTEGKYEFSYNWNGNGESTYDYLRVALVPASTTLTAGTSYPSGFGTSSLPTGWVALDGGGKLNQATSWQSKSATINVAAGNYYMVLAWYNDYSGGTNPPAAVDNVSITRVACPYDVAGLAASNITTNGATLTWTAGEATQWQVATKTGDADWAVLPTIYNTNSAALTGLTAATTYQVKARAYCNASDQGTWCDPINFATACEAITIDGEHPYTENFDNYVTGNNALPLCWSYINTTTNATYKYYPKIYNYNSNSQPNQLQLLSYAYYGSGGTTTSDPKPQYAILPEMNDLSGLRMKLYARANSTGSSYDATFHVGIMSDPTDASTFVEIGSGYTPASTTYELFTIPFNSYSGSGKYIAIMIEAAEGSGTYASFYKSVYIDDITVEPIPSCTEPSALQFVSSTTNTATLSWTAGGTESSWDIYYSTTNAAPTSSTAPLANVTTNNPATISGLAASTTYFVWVRAHCGDGDGQQSPWIGGISFVTACEAISTFPWTENFEGMTASTVPLCWDNSATTGTDYASHPEYYWGVYEYSGNKMIRMHNYSAHGPLAIINTPIIDLPAEAKELTFEYAHNATCGEFSVKISEDGGSSFTELASYAKGSGSAYNNPGTFTEATISLADYTNKSVILQFYSAPNYGSGAIFVDNIRIDVPPTCLKPSAFASSATTAHTATLSWTKGEAGQDAWQIAYSTSNSFAPAADFTPGDGEGLVDADNNTSFELTGLAQSTTYYAYVRANCGNGDYSAWNSTRISFSTPAGNRTPTGLTVDNATITSSQATASWTPRDGNTLHESYDIYWALASVSEVPAEPTAPNLISGITGTSQVITGLEAETTYKVWVRDNCGADGYSNWSSTPFTFMTAAACQTPDGLAASNVTTNSATISWNTYGQSAFNLRYSTDGANWTLVEDVNGDSYTINGTLSSNTAYQVQVQPTCADAETWSAVFNFTTKCDAITAFPVTYGFETSEGFPANASTPTTNQLGNCWRNQATVQNGTNPTRVWGTSTSYKHDGSQALTLPDKGNSTNFAKTMLAFPAMDFTSANGYTVSFWIYRPNSGSNPEGFKVYASHTDTIDVNAVELGHYSRNYNIAYPQVEATSGWYQYEINIPQATMTGTVYLIFEGQSYYGSATYVDDIIIDETPTCSKPSGLTFESATTTTATLSWTAGGSETSWDIYYSTENVAPTTQTGTNTTANPATIEGLNASTTYYVWVRAHCTNEDQSPWIGGISFATQCETTVVDAGNPFFEGFENSTFPPACWSIGEPANNNSTNNWIRSTSNTNNGAGCAYSNYYGPIYLYTPTLHIDGTKATLSFSSYNTYIDDYDKNSVLISVDGGAWTEIWSPAEVEQAHVTTTIDLTSYVGQDIQLCFKYEGSNAHGWYLDDVNLYVPTTIEKEIAANKWYAIAPPVHDNGVNLTIAGVTNLTSGTYDLYGFTESAGTWNAPSETLNQGKGYIYRRSTAATITFVGLPNEGDKAITLTNQCPDVDIDGFNLIGNPFPHVISYSNYYTLQPNGLWLAHDAGTIGVAEGFLVHTDASGTEQIIIDDATPSKKGAPAASPAITFTVSNGEYRDVAYAKFDGSAVLPKIGHLEPSAPALSIPVDGKKYAIADLGNDCESFDMVFSGIGDYTISASGDATYLHLIDKVTGSDIDLLSQPYTFKAGIGDITSRFIVKLVPDGETVSAGNFAFRNGNGWTIEGDGTLEAYDALGRRIFAQEISSSNYQLSKASFPAAGVYVLRMGGNSQKIVVTE